MLDKTEEQLEKEIQEKQQQLHELRYGEIDKAYAEFQDARKVALEKYEAWKETCQKHGSSPNSIMYYFNTWKF